MHAWEQIQKTVDYIEEHIDEKPDIEKLAKLACLSPFYYQRLFSRLVKKPVAEYVKLRRIAKAADELKKDDRRILDIALELGFSSHEHFTRTFKETFGMTPAEYRKTPTMLNRMTKPELLLNYALIDEGVPLITEGIVLEINRRELPQPTGFVGSVMEQPVELISGFGTESGVDPLEELWNDVHAQKQAALGLDTDAEELGVALPSEKQGYFCYFAGARSDKPAPDGFIGWELPAGKYVVCEFEAENFELLVMDALYKAQSYVYNVWLANHKLQTAPFCAERYANHSPDTTRMELWLELID